jgi:hypothetical protein
MQRTAIITEDKDVAEIAEVVNKAAEQKEETKSGRMLAALTAHPLREIYETTELTLPVKQAVSLPSKLRRVAEDKNPIILFASAYGREEAPNVGFRTARTAAKQSMGNVLYIHASSRLPKFFRDIEMEIPVTLGEFVNKGGGSMLPFVALEDSGLICAHYRGLEECMSADNLQALMAALRERFELVVIGGDDILTGGPASAFIELVDGTILVTEAERTRVPVAKRLKRTVEESGGEVIGAILNQREYHIPGWIYSLMYGSVQ